MKLTVAAAQFPVDVDVERNLGFVLRQIGSAARRGADVVLFPESALGGYPGADFESFAGYDWDRLRRATEAVLEAAERHRVWVLLGSHHRLSGRSRPHNSIYVIDPRGRVVDRYDKRLLARTELAHFTPGTRAVVVRIRGVRCGLAVCHEWRYPEVYRDYKGRGVEVVLQAWYDGRYRGRAARAEGAMLSGVIPAAVRGHAACNHVWICGANTSARYSCFGAFVVRPDGTFLARQPRHRPGVLVRTIDTDARLADLAAHGRPRAMRGVDRLGPASRDRRSVDRRCI